MICESIFPKRKIKKYRERRRDRDAAKISFDKRLENRMRRKKKRKRGIKESLENRIDFK